MIAKGLKFNMAYSPTLEGEVHAVNGNVVDVILTPSDGNAWWVRWDLLTMKGKFKEGIYKEKEKEIRLGI